MVTDQKSPASDGCEWTRDWITQSPMFAPLDGVASRLPANVWPDVGALNALCDELGGRAVNSRGERIRFVAQTGKSQSFEEAFEPRAYLSAEVQVRRQNWHDVFNALVWMAFPRTKAAINSRHFALLQERKNQERKNQQRSPAGDALTLFDEDGMVVLSRSEQLLKLVRDFRWKELFWAQRDAVRAEMRFLLFGHAMYEKALNPFVGMTAKSILFVVPDAILKLQGAALNNAVDLRLADYVADMSHLTHGKSLSPLPVLGVPGWWRNNDAESFYEDVSYFRPGRGGAPFSESSSIS